MTQTLSQPMGADQKVHFGGSDEQMGWRRGDRVRSQALASSSNHATELSPSLPLHVFYPHERHHVLRITSVLAGTQWNVSFRSLQGPCLRAAGSEGNPKTVFFNMFPTSRLWGRPASLPGRKSHDWNGEIVKAPGVGVCTRVCVRACVCGHVSTYAPVARQEAHGQT